MARQSVGIAYSSALKTVWNTVPSNMAIMSLETSLLFMRTSEASAISIASSAASESTGTVAAAVPINGSGCLRFDGDGFGRDG